MTEPMREQILSQPALLRAVLSRWDELAGHRTAAGVRGIWAVGHGDSYFAPLAAAAAFRRWSAIPYAPVMAQELVAYPPPGLDEHALVIAVSMSGGVRRTIAAAETARARGARVLAITNSPDSPLAGMADEVFLLHVPDPAPFLAGTATYTASLLALLMMAVPEAARSALAAAVDALESALEHEVVIREWAEALASSSVWYVLGMNCQVATACYGAAKLVETADVVAVAHETEEFFHEHHWVVRSDHPVVLLAHDDASRQRSEAAAAHLRELDVPVWAVGRRLFVGGVRQLSIVDIEPWCAPIPGAAPLQWLAYWLSRSRGFDPDRRSHLRDGKRYAVSRKYR